MSYVGADGSIGSVGISINEAVGRILAGGVRDMADWVNKLYGQAFAAVYVQPGAKVAVHLEKPLAIDFDPEGRKVRSEEHTSELQSLMRISYAVFCLKKKKPTNLIRKHITYDIITKTTN